MRAPGLYAEGAAEVPVAAGGAATVRVHVRNDAAEVRDAVVGVVGLDPDWSPAPVRVAALPPGGAADVDLDVSPPVGTPAGRYPYVVTAQEVDPRAGTSLGMTQSDATLVVGDVGALSVSLVPAEPAGGRGKRLRVMVDNSGTDPVRVRLSVRTSVGLFLRLRRHDVEVPAGTTARVSGRVQVARRRWTGAPRRLPFVLTAQADSVPLRLDGVFTSRPVLGSGTTRVLALVVVVALWAGAVAVAVTQASKRASRQPAAATAQPARQGGAGKGGQNGGEQAKGGKGAGGQGGAGQGAGRGAGGQGAGARQPTGTRLTGTVTGAAPGGVTVSLRPTSLVDEQAQAAQFVGVSPPATAVGKVAAALVAYTPPQAVSTTRSTVTAGDGAWAFAGVRAPGYYLLTFSKPGYQTTRYVVSAAAGGEPTPLQVTLQAGTGRLTGTVQGPAGPLGGASLTITDGTLTVTTSSTTTGSVGRFAVDGLSTPGTYLVTAARDGYGAASTLVSLPAGGSDSVRLRMRPGVEALVGSVSGPDSTGAVGGVGGVTVTVTDGKTTRTATTVTTGPVGAYVLPQLPVPATYTVSVSGSGYAPQTQQVRLSGAESARRLDATLSSAMGTVTGTAAGPDGTGLVGAGLTLTGDAGTFKTMSVSSPPGSFRFSGVPPGSYVLVGEQFGRVPAYAPVDVVMAQTADVPLTLAPVAGDGLPPTARIRGRVVDARTGGQLTCDPSTKPAPCVVTISTVDRRADGDVRFETTAAPGSDYVLPPADANPPAGLLPGLHTLRISAPGYEVATVDVQVPLGQVVEAPQVALSPAGVIVGTVGTRVGAVPKGTCVLAVPVTGTPGATAPPCTVPPDPVPTCTVDPPARCAPVGIDGSYAIRGLDHGSYAVYVVPADPEYVAVPPVVLTLAVGDTKRYDATLQRLSRLDVSVLEPNGAGTPSLVKAGVDVDVRPVLGGVAGPVVAHVPTDDTGTALVTKLPPGSYQVSAVDGTLQGSVGGVSVGLNQELPVNLVLTDAPAGFRGAVVSKVDGVDQPVAGAKVTVTGVVGYNGLTPKTLTRTVTTDVTGCFAVTPDGSGGCGTAGSTAALALVTSQVQIGVDGTAAGYGTLPATEYTLKAGNTLTLTLAPPATPVTGRLTVSPTPSTAVDFSKATVTLTTNAPGAGTVVVTVAGDGTLSWTDPLQPKPGLARPGTYTVKASLAGYDDAVQTFTVPLTTSSPPTPYTIPDFVLTAYGALTVKAADVAGNPVTGAVFTLTGGGRPPVTVAAAPGADSVTFPQLSASVDYTARVQAAGYAFTDSAPLRPVAGGTGTGTVPLTQLGAVSGVVYGRAGPASTPLPGVTVTATLGTQTFTAVTDTNGAYRVTGTVAVEGLAAGDWAVSTSAPGYTAGADAAKTATVVTTADTTGVDLVLDADPVQLTVVVQDDKNNPQPVDSATVTLKLGTSSISPDSASGGNYVFASLVPTRYSLLVSAANYAPVSTSVTVDVGVAQQTAYVTLATRTNSVLGTVNGQRGAAAPAPLDGATVTATSGGSAAATATTGTDGSYQLDLPDGNYTLTFAGTGYVTQTKSLKVGGGQVVTLDVTLQAVSYQLTVTVTSTSGQSMSGAVVTLTSGDPGVPAQTATATPPKRNADPVAVFNQVMPGDYTIATTGPGEHLDGSGSVTVTNADASATVQVKEKRLQVTVSTAGTTPASATLTLTPSTGTASTYTVSAAGTTELYLPQGAYTAAVSANGYQGSSAATGSGDDAAVALTLTQYAGLTVTATDGSGATVDDGATVALSPTSGGCTATSGGTATCSKLLPGDYTVTVKGTVTTTSGGTTTKKNVTGSAAVTLAPGEAGAVTVTVS